MTTRQSPSSLSRFTGEEGDGLLRFALRLDALASGALGVLALAAAPLLEDVLGAPLGLLLLVGPALVAWAAALWFAASRPEVSRPAAWSVVALNLLWVVASVAAVAAGWFSLTALGIAFFLVQAAAVAFFADAQLLGLRRIQATVA